MVTTANRTHIETISKVRLIRLLKGNIIVPNSSFQRLKPRKKKRQPSLPHLKENKPQTEETGT